MPETRMPNPAAACATSRPMAPRPTMPMRRFLRVRMAPLASISSSDHSWLAWRRSTSGSWRASASVTAMTCSAIARARTPRALVRTIGLALSSSERMWLTPAAGACTHRSRVSDGTMSRSTNAAKATSALRQRRAQRLAVPDIHERVLRKLAPQIIHVAARQHPRSIGTHDTHDNLHESLEVRKLGSMEVWKFGSAEVWK